MRHFFRMFNLPEFDSKQNKSFSLFPLQALQSWELDSIWIYLYRLSFVCLIFLKCGAVPYPYIINQLSKVIMHP